MVMEFPVTRDLRTAALFVELAKRWRYNEAFHEDPMTASCGCVDDFAEDFDRKERAIWAKLLRRSQETGEKEVERFALDGLERWMP